MYLQFHQLNSLPFENTPDPRFFFLGEDHREALANLVYAIRSQKGMVLITGDVGMGKTTTSYFLETRIGDAAKLVVIRSVPSTPKQLLWNVAAELGLGPDPSLTRGQLVSIIRQELERQHELKRTVLLMLDEAQALPMAVLDEVRLLSNMETTTHKLCQILLIGQSELRNILQLPRFEPLRQRVVLAHHINPFSLDSTKRYIEHRIRRASIAQPSAVSFTPEALERIYDVTGGIIRQINVVCDKALLVASVKRRHVVGMEEVNEAVQPMVGPVNTSGTVWADRQLRRAA